MGNATVAWHCPICGRIEAPAGQRHCPKCGQTMQRCSRYEWFLADELRAFLNHTQREYQLQEQYPIRDHRGFTWYWDIFVWIQGSSVFGGYGELIDINGPNHGAQRRYSGPGGGYTRDDDKHWEAFSVEGWTKASWLRTGRDRVTKNRDLVTI